VLKNVDSLGDSFASSEVTDGEGGRGRGQNSSDKITFPTLLNVLDGAVGNTNGVMMMLTTRNLERLKRVLAATKSTALLRAGRCVQPFEALLLHITHEKRIPTLELTTSQQDLQDGRVCTAIQVAASTILHLHVRVA
jgi:hypothetical protein